MTPKRAAASFTSETGIGEVPGQCGAWCLQSPRDVAARRMSTLDLTDGAPMTAGLRYWTGRLRSGVAPDLVADLTGFSSDERGRLSRLSRVEDRAGYAAAHGALRVALAAVLGRAPGELRFVRTPEGAPRLADRPRPHFSLSHCGEVAAIAIADRPVGIDVERVVWTDDLMDVAEQFFAPSIRHEIAATAPSGRADAFARHWTLSEAFAKATGLGVTAQFPASFSIGDCPDVEFVAPIFGIPADWRVGMVQPLHPHAI